MHDKAIVLRPKIAQALAAQLGWGANWQGYVARLAASGQRVSLLEDDGRTIGDIVSGVRRGAR